MTAKDIQPQFPIEFIKIPAGNFRKGRPQDPDVIVMHITEGSRKSVIAEFTRESQKSTHLMVCKDGAIVQFVGTGDTAFGNGVVSQPTSEIVLERKGKNPNGYTISIEHEGYATQDLTEAQYEASARLVAFLSEKWSIPLDTTHVIGHREITGYKSCPGVLNVEKVLQMARSIRKITN